MPDGARGLAQDMEQPFFSIVIPTRNRAAELYHTIRTCLDQDFGREGPESYEVIVSDNCSTDNIKDVVRQFPPGKIRYERTDKYLSMADSWEFALSTARGRYVGFVATDDGYLLNALSDVYRIIRATNAPVVTFQGVQYFWPNYYDPKMQNKLLIPQYIFEEGPQASSKLVQQALQTLLIFRLPSFRNSFCSAELIQRIKRETGRIFSSFVPDVYVSMLFACRVPEIYVSRKILHVGGLSQDSGYASLKANPFGRKIQEHMAMYKEERLREGLITDYPFAYSLTADAMVKALAACGDTDGFSKLNFRNYLAGCCYEALLAIDRNNQRQAFRAIKTHMAGLDHVTAFRIKVAMKLRKLRWKCRAILGESIWRLIQSAAYRLGMQNGVLHPACFDKEQTNVENVYDAAVWASSYLTECNKEMPPLRGPSVSE